MAIITTGATNPIGRLISIEKYGTAIVRAAQSEPSSSDKYVKYNSKNTRKKKGNGTGTQTVNDGAEVTVTYPKYIKYGAKITSGKNKGKQCQITWKGEYTAKGFLSTLSNTYIKEDVDKYTNTWFVDSSEDIPEGNTHRIKTPSEFEITLQDIDVEDEGSTTDVGRDKKGVLDRNRVRDNIVTIEVKWSHLKPNEAKEILQILSQSGGRKYEWIYVEFLNPYSNSVDRKRMYAGDRSLKASYGGNYSDMSVKLVER